MSTYLDVSLESNLAGMTKNILAIRPSARSSHKSAWLMTEKFEEIVMELNTRAPTSHPFGRDKPPPGDELFRSGQAVGAEQDGFGS